MDAHRSAAAALTAAGVVVLLVGCSSTADEFRQSRLDATSAISSATAAARLADAGRASGGYLTTQYSDDLTELQGAERSIESVQPTGDQVSQRDRLLAEVRTAIGAVLDAQQALQGGRLPPTDELSSARSGLR